jgi:outer membrane protein assembly factor BamE (lipoprotein component of BamABCDE complex)
MILPVCGALFMAITFASCATYEGAESRKNIQQLKSGMGENQVLNLLGTPDSVLHPDEKTDRWVYEYKRESKQGHNLFVEFKDGNLTHMGELSGRDVAAAEETRTPGNCTKWKRPDFVEESLCTH